MGILVAVRDLDSPGPILEGLAAMGHALGPQDYPGRLFLRKGGPRTRHLHLVGRGPALIRPQLVPRLPDGPCPEPGERERPKRTLASRHRLDRAYVRGKAGTVETVLRQETRERRSSPAPTDSYPRGCVVVPGTDMRIDLGGIGALYPMPVVIVGAMDGDRENFATIAHVGILNFGRPQYISIGLHKSHRSNDCIKAAKAFSVCLPSQEMVVETDHVGMVSGKSDDKSKVFGTFFSEARNAPMVKECPVCMDCRLHDVLDYETHEVFVGEILHTYADEEVLTDGKVDVAKLRPMLFDMGSKQYWSLGPPIARCWDVGRGYRPKEPGP